MADDKAIPTSTTETDEIDEKKLDKVAGGVNIQKLSAEELRDADLQVFVDPVLSERKLP